MQALSGMIGRKASVGGFLSSPSNPRAQPWTGGGNYQAGVRGANGIRYPSSPSRKRWILGVVRIDPCNAVANALSIPPGETLPGLDMPRILLKERGAFGNADTGGAWLSSARAVRLPVISRRKAATRLHEAGIASNRRSAIRRRIDGAIQDGPAAPRKRIED
ncbi:hypothetical protein RIF29_47081 [Crotalaria pallida]|uniref:Uncharacterized protein n=1 Tax=Crotalaria pallida TaxID=3830 RepID=A0AAN9HK51_CROPI